MALDLLATAHVNLNCRQLAVSRRFYEQALGLKGLVHTDPEAQDGRAFGLSGPIRWDAWMLHDGRALGAAAIDLLEWKQPRPIGEVDAAPGRLGLARLAFGAPDLEAARARIGAAGARQLSKVAQLPLPGGEVQAAFGARDPDGCALLVTLAEESRLDHVEIGCTDLAGSAAWFGDVLGLVPLGEQEAEAAPGEPFGSAGTVSWSARSLALPGQEPGGFRVALMAWREPGPNGAPAAEANHLGLYRMAFLTDDIDRDHRELRGLGVAALTEPVTLDLGPSCPAPSCRALFFRDPDGNCLELIETPTT